MANKVVLGGTDVVKQDEEDSMSHSEEVKYKMMKKQKKKNQKTIKGLIQENENRESATGPG